jgi:hypothetical protein
MDDGETGVEAVIVEPQTPARKVTYHVSIFKEIRSWAVTLIVLGIIHLVTSGFLSSSWGVLIILVGIASFYFRSASMMVVFAVTLAGAAFTNLLSGNTKWIIFAILQAGLVVSVFLKYVRFKKAEADTTNGEPEDVGLTPKRSAKAFPWLAFGLGLFSMVGFVSIMIYATISITMGALSNFTKFLDFIFDSMRNFGMLGIGFGLAGLLNKYQKTACSILGIVFGALTILVMVLLSL